VPPWRVVRDPRAVSVRRNSKARIETGREYGRHGTMNDVISENFSCFLSDCLFLFNFPLLWIHWFFQAYVGYIHEFCFGVESFHRLIIDGCHLELYLYILIDVDVVVCEKELHQQNHYSFLWSLQSS
jgi:hypothetical protein